MNVRFVGRVITPLWPKSFSLLDVSQMERREIK
jgi:hypothetical protein